LAADVAAIIECEMGLATRLYGEVCFVLAEPAPSFEHKAVRLLGPQDAGLLSQAPPELRGTGWGTIETMLADGVAAVGIVDGRVVAIAHTSGHTRRYADIGVFTHEDYRSRGLSTTAASLVAHRVQQLGLTPVWSTGCDNLASLRVAEKLGFSEVSRGTYVILEQPDQRAE
jgi:GNAT superfamily N-acetyltransferase